MKFVQFMKNRAFYRGIKCSPYKAMFECKLKIILNNCIFLIQVLDKLKIENELEKNCNY